jgi:hypothetical protein
MTTPPVTAVRSMRRLAIPARLGLESGALPIAIGSVVSGVTAYLFLIVAARQVGPVRYSALATLWTVVFLVGPACFAPLEQEVCRAGVARRAAGAGDRPAVIRGAQVGGTVLLALLVALAIAQAPLRQHLFEGDGLLVLEAGLGLVGYYGMYLTWGILASRRHFRGYGLVTGSEGLWRLAVSGLLLVLGARSLGGFGVAIGLAPLAAAATGWRAEPVHLVDGDPQPWQPTTWAIGYLLGASALRQFLLMVGPVAVQVLARPAQRGEAGRFLAALALTRVPLFLVVAVLAALLPSLARYAAEGRRQEFSAVLRRLSAAVVLVIGAAALLIEAVGPQLLRTFFGASYALPSRDLVLLTVGCGFFMLALVQSYGLIALDGHSWTMAAWGAGCLAFVALLMAAPGLGLLGRVEWGFFAATAVAAGAMGALLVWRHWAHPWFRRPGELIGEPVP